MKKKAFIDEFLKSQNLSINKESRFAIVKKLVFLKNDSILQFLKKKKFLKKKFLKLKKMLIFG